MGYNIYRALYGCIMFHKVSPCIPTHSLICQCIPKYEGIWSHQVTQTHPYTSTHTCTPMCKGFERYLGMQTHSHTCTHTYLHMHKSTGDTGKHKQTCIHAHIHGGSVAPQGTNTHAYIYACIHMCKGFCTAGNTDKAANMCTYICKHAEGTCKNY